MVHILSCGDISIFPLEISSSVILRNIQNLKYITYKICSLTHLFHYFIISLFSLFHFHQVFKASFNEHGSNFDDASKIDYNQPPSNKDNLR